MKITSVKAIITEKDVLSIINEFVDVKGLNIEDIKIKDFITITGKYSKFPFTAIIGIGDVYKDILYIKILDIKLKKWRVFNGIKNFALKKAISKFSHYGLSMQGDNLSVNMSVISKLIPKVDFKLKRINVLDGKLEVEAEDIFYSSKEEVEEDFKEVEY